MRVESPAVDLPHGIVYARGHQGGDAHRVRVEGRFLWKGTEKFFLKGVTYGPFAPNAAGEYFASKERTHRDFRQIAGELGANTIRTYYAPPAWLVDQAEAAGLHILVDVPWPKHLCFIEDKEAQRDARRAVRDAVRMHRGRSSILAYSIANEVPPVVARWYGAPKVEAFLAELVDIARQEDGDALVTYANYPSTEFLDTSFVDFAMFNVYLQDEMAFRRYLTRLQNQVGDRPLVLGEFGLDTFRNSEAAQAEMLAWHLNAVRAAGLAGTTVYAWTDDWFTGGHQIEDWAFGITDRNRNPKPAFDAVRAGFARKPVDLLPPDRPRVSVVVCSYNGGKTLDQCLDSLQRLDYPDYEVILVDDGSTDDTRRIAARFPDVKAIHQENRGLSYARNVGMRHASGAVVAYTDSDCFADPDWLTYLVLQMERTGAAAVGGPNLTPDDGALASWVSLSPGQPGHVLLTDEIAEHIPGCNMAFRKEVLEAIDGFDPQYRVAGDDVDLCWRLQNSGHWIAFAPGAFVWHHRRQSIQTYLKQQRGYGHAEGLLKFKHPEKFNARGDSRWHGSLYGATQWGIRWGRPIIHHGVFGSGLFQTLYTRGAAHTLMVPSSLEWLATAILLLAGAPFHWLFAAIAGGMLLASLTVAAVQSLQARVPSRYDSAKGRGVIAYLCFVQPLVRSIARYRCHVKEQRMAPRSAEIESTLPVRPLFTRFETAYWGEAWQERTVLVQRFADQLEASGVTAVLDSGWTDWDLEAYLGVWAKVRVTTVEEDHGGGHHLVRVRFNLRPTLFSNLAVLLLVLITLLVPPLAAPGALCAGWLWLQSALRARAIPRCFHRAAESMGFWNRPWRTRAAVVESPPVERVARPLSPKNASLAKTLDGRVFDEDATRCHPG